MDTVRTLVLSDLHLGAARATDVLRRPGPLAQCCEHLHGVDRLVLLGDTLELRHGPARDALAVAEPVFAALGAALGEDGEIVLVAGNHDHGLIAPWLRSRGARREPAPLGLDTRTGPRAGPAIGRLARAAAPARLTVAYPGVFVRDDIYATHGHYLDCLTTLPAFERLAAGMMARIRGPLPDTDATAEDFEAHLAPTYAWLDALSDSRPPSASPRGRQGASAAAWELLSSTGQRPLKARALASLFPLGIHGLNRLGLGPLTADISGEALRDAGLVAIADVLTRLDVRAEHVIFGHTHRAGPLDADDTDRWRVPATGSRLYNGGCWVDDPALAGGGPRSPYRAGRGVIVDEEGPPRVVRLVDADDLGTAPPDAPGAAQAPS